MGVLVEFLTSYEHFQIVNLKVQFLEEYKNSIFKK